MTRAALVTVVALAAVAGACGKKRDAVAGAGDAGAGATASSGLRAPPERTPPERQPRLKRTLAPIEVKDVEPMLPVLAGATIVRPLGKAKVGERVEVAFCVEKGELDTIGEAIVKRYQEAGWEGVVYRPAGGEPPRGGVQGSRTPFHLFGSLQRGKWAECNGDKGMTLVTMGAHKFAPVQGSPDLIVPGAVGPTGTTGLSVGGGAGGAAAGAAGSATAPAANP